MNEPIKSQMASKQVISKEERSRRYSELKDAGASREEAVKLRDSSSENYERALRLLRSYKDRREEERAV